MDSVIIPKSEYDALLKDKVFLEILIAHGVDNWSGYDDACVEYEEEYPEEE